ncbi:U3 small nucleolar RNA-associated protein 12, putative (UTP12) [Plasmodium malariae]|uniref:U3 small nucleolar RNA-associated protein 12, putative (UTP12) n=1 Tax=Plasmodium malariae TaxID=5858 RepID=A0A1A8W735_PLAMA|nr:U3 small nucleolar RNA-associated protein 12, putative (UTP12) [Plasmodium malariae]
MVKSYDRYEFEDCFGIVNSRTSNCVFLNYNNILSGHDECVSVWNVNEKEIKKKLTVPFVAPYYFFSYHVTYICINEKNKNIIAVGYMNGSIRLFDIEENRIVSTFTGHTATICKLKFNKDGNYLCSCSKDTNIIIWDVTNDKGIFKLEGHSNIVTDVEFLKMRNDYVDDFISNNLLISVSKDCLIKVWELNIQSCVQTVVDCEEDITCLIVNETNTRLIIACFSFLRIYKIDLYSNIKDKFTNCIVYITFLTSIKRTNNCRISSMKMVFCIEHEAYLEEGQKDSFFLSLDNDCHEGGANDESGFNGNDGSSGTNANFCRGGICGGREDDAVNVLAEDKNTLNFLNNTLNRSVKFCSRSSYCSEGDNSGILVCCTNSKKIEIYKINSVKNQKKSEKNRKKRYVEKLNKKKKAIIKEQKRIEKFKGKNAIDYNNLQQKLEEIEQEIDIYKKYEIHTADDEVKYLFYHNCKFKLQDIDIYKKRKKDNYVYFLVSYSSNRLHIFQVNLFDILNNRDIFLVMNEGQGLQEGISPRGVEVTSEGRECNKGEKEKKEGDEEEEEQQQKQKQQMYEEEEDKDESENEAEDESGEKKGENGEDVMHGAKIVEKKIYDYSKCFKEICEINKGHNSSVDFLKLSENNELMISICKKYVKVWNMKNFQNVITICSEGSTSAFFFHNDEYIVISNDTGYIYVYELKNIELVHTYKAHANRIINLCKDSRSNGFLSVGEENYLKIFEFTTGEKQVSNKNSEDQSGEEGGNPNLWRSKKRTEDSDTGEENRGGINVGRKKGGKEGVRDGKREKERKLGSRRGTTGKEENKMEDENEEEMEFEAEDKMEFEAEDKMEDETEEEMEDEVEDDICAVMFHERECYNLTDKVSCAMYSPNGKYICIGYLNNLIEVLYSDTLKLHLTLYGHSLPITCMDISKDNKILASGSSDKYLFLWNLEYGSINKRLHIDCDVLTRIQFFYEHNNLISISRDGYIKMWDCVKFQCICTVDGTFGTLTSLVISSTDDFFLTSGNFKSIRYWKRGDDLIFLEEERDKELNLQIEKEALRNDLLYPSSVEKNVLLNKATIKTIETIKSSEKLIEYLDIIEEELTLLDIYYKNLTAYEEAKQKNELPDFVQAPNKPKPRPELLHKNPFEFIIEVMCNIKNNILNEVLISLPFSYAYKLLNYIKTYLIAFYFFQKIQDNYKKFIACGNFNFHVEYSINIVLSIINIYRNQFLFDTKFRFLLYELHQLITPHLKKSVEQCSFNQTTLDFLINSLDNDGYDDDNESEDDVNDDDVNDDDVNGDDVNGDDVNGDDVNGDDVNGDDDNDVIDELYLNAQLQRDNLSRYKQKRRSRKNFKAEKGVRKKLHINGSLRGSDVARKAANETGGEDDKETEDEEDEITNGAEDEITDGVEDEITDGAEDEITDGAEDEDK